MENTKLNILLVDDNHKFLTAAAERAKIKGFNVLTAENGKEALEVYNNNQDIIDFVVLDMIMPNMGAAETYDGLQAINPAIKVLLSSGYGADQQTGELLNRGCDGFIQKPFNMQSLSEKIEEILTRP